MNRPSVGSVHGFRMYHTWGYEYMTKRKLYGELERVDEGNVKGEYTLHSAVRIIRLRSHID